MKHGILVSAEIILVTIFVAGCTRDSGKDVCGVQETSATLSKKTETRNEHLDRQMKVSVDVRRKIGDEMARLQNAALTNFTEEGVARFSDRVDALVSSFPEKSRMRRELAEMFADKTAQLLMGKMIEGEKSSDFSTAGLYALSNRLTAACCLIERQWRNSVLCDRVIRGFDVSWVNYLNRESQRQRDSGKLEFAAMLADFAARLDALADSPTGPLKMSFDQYCQAFGNIPKATPEIVNKTLKNYLDGEIRKGLGHYPAWAARWCRMSGLEMEE